MRTIPEFVLAKIVSHRPHLAKIVDNLKADPQRASQFEKAVAVAYLAGETTLTVRETLDLSSCAAGRPYASKESQEVR